MKLGVKKTKKWEEPRAARWMVVDDIVNQPNKVISVDNGVGNVELESGITACLGSLREKLGQEEQD
jgi:hypothetical protein